MDIVIFSRDATYDSLINNLTMAMSLEKAGKTVGIIFSGDALNCLCGGVIGWSKSLSGIQTKKTISKEAKNMGIAITGPTDPREIDIKPLIQQAKEAGVSLYACPVWTGLLKLRERLPAWLTEIETRELADEIISSDKVIGG